MVQYYATPAVRGGGNTYESNANAYHQQMQAARQPQYGQGGNQTAQPLQQQNFGGQLGGSYASQTPSYQSGAALTNYNAYKGMPMGNSAASSTAYRAGSQGITGGGGIPGARFGQTGAAFNPQVNAGVNYEYRNPQTGQTYNINRAVSKFQNGLALNSLVNYINALRQQQLQQSGGLGGLLNTNTPGFYGV